MTMQSNFHHRKGDFDCAFMSEKKNIWNDIEYFYANSFDFTDMFSFHTLHTKYIVKVT